MPTRTSSSARVFWWTTGRFTRPKGGKNSGACGSCRRALQPAEQTHHILTNIAFALTLISHRSCYIP